MPLPIRNKILLLVILLLAFVKSEAQVKIGTSPTSLEKSALLELNGNRQGLLLPRLSDTSIINTLAPPDGMLIYYQANNSGRGLYLRKSGFWQRITTDSLLNASLVSWNLAGNNSLTGTEKLGPNNAVPLNIVTAGTSRIVIDATGNTSIIGNTTLGGTFTLNPAATSTDTTALFLNSSNTVVKRNLNNVAFSGAIQSINGLTPSAQTISTNATAGALGFTSTGSSHVLSIPDASISTRGFVNLTDQSFAGNKTFSNNLTVAGITSLIASANTTDTNFLMLNAANQVTKRNFSSFPGIQSLNGLTAATQTFATSANQATAIGFSSTGTVHTLNLTDADSTIRGFVTTSAQRFGGDKSFKNNVTVSGITTLSPTAATDTSFLMINAANQVTRRNFSSFSFPGIQSLNGLTATAQTFANSTNQALPIGFTSSGSIHTLNIPNADSTITGLVTATAQRFGGDKSFKNNLTVSGTTTLSPTAATDTSFLMINANNQVTRRNFSSFSFPGIQNLNGLTATTQTFTNSTNQALPIGFTSSGSTHTLNIPNADSTITGLVTTTAQRFGGDKSFKGNLTVSGITTLSPVSNTTDTGFLMINANNQVTRRNFSTFSFPGIQNLNGLTTTTQTFANSTNQALPIGFTSSGSIHTLNIPNSDSTITGLMTATTQRFGGDKSFKNNLTVSGTTTLAGANSTTDTLFLMTNLTNSQVERRNISSLPFIQNLNGLTTSTQSFGVTTNAAAIAFNSAGSTHNLNIPDADASNRGVINTGSQTFAGAKIFNSTITVNNTGSTGTSGLAIPKLTSATSETSGAKSIGVDASGNVVRTPTSPTYYTTGGTANVTKVWIGRATNTAGTGTLNFDISSAGFTNVLNIQATAQRNGTNAIQQPFAVITTATTTAVQIKITRGYLMLLLGNSLVAEDDVNTVVHLRVEGN
ncbi:hypothetical protein SAMN05421788_1011175 [Filimonas lacunae]|uniref:Uncharacterized protein n=1 Tax=Filimonas lacunae TaxID=477680 RepID=A0A173MQT5_9BACT|nr:hypothetical protein [Filimonas lacunae]BAV09741.1 hypothetical protein FLA_5794 [Filimonas lacunae]SIS78230.1 hypothetical protein SAMN05421788_1011175 [Filimonas lacunae]